MPPIKEVKKMPDYKKLENYKFLRNVVDDLRFSQGFYGRLFRDLITLEQNKTEFERFINQLPEFKTKLDVVYFFEC